MRPERWQAIEKLYHSASDLPDGQRNSFLSEACDGDRALFDEVESLIKHGSGSQSFLDTPAVAIMAKAMAADEFRASTPSLEGKIVSHYRILEPIGRGGMGIVYRAEDMKLGRRVALKLLPEYLARDKGALRRFEREARAASALNHPNICTIHEIDESEDLHFIAIELLEGETLKQRMARSRLPIKEILRIGVEICEALDAAHSAGIIHRDVKPANIFLTRRGTVKVLDFGVAKRVGSELIEQSPHFSFSLMGNLEADLTNSGALIGTTAYMSPEQVTRQTVDTRSDIFSLGAVLYEMTTGQMPFPGTDVTSVVRRVQLQRPIPVEQINPEARSGLNRIIDKALQKDRSSRYQSAAELQADLRKIQGHLERRAKWWRASLVPLGLVALLAVVLAASRFNPRIRQWIAGTPSVGISHNIRSLAVLPFENPTADPAQDYLVEGMSDALIADLSKLTSLRVISRTSSMQYKGTHKALPEVARELNVDAVVLGSVARSGNRIRINAKLVEAASGQNLWVQDYDRDESGVLKLQNDLAAAVAREVAGKLTGNDRSRMAQGPQSVNPQAYESYLKAEYFSSKETDEGFEKAIGYYRKAIELDPSFAAAYLGLGGTYAFMAYQRRLNYAEGSVKAENLLAMSLELDPNSSLAHALSGMIKFQFRCDRPGAEKELNRALELNPNDMAAVDYHSYYLLEMGRTDEAITEKRRVLEHDPVAVGTSSELGLYYLTAGRNDEAIEQLQKTLELDPNYPSALTRLGRAYAVKGEYDQAVKYIRKAIAVDNTPGRLVQLGDVYARWGKTQEALDVIQELTSVSDKRYVSPSLIAGIYARLGEKGLALWWLERAKKQDRSKLSDPDFDSLRSDPKFKVIEARLKPDTTCPDF
jgi:serine/threonine protein kinase/Tfp pilus assembly protein PilF